VKNEKIKGTNIANIYLILSKKTLDKKIEMNKLQVCDNLR